jgi:thiazole synthase ThiGH ThiG subunit
MTLLNATKNRAVQRLKMAEAMKAARQRGERNDLAFLTTPEPPHDAA